MADNFDELPNTEDDLPINTEPHNKDAQSNDQPDSSVECTLSGLTINVFFDGTGNDKFNTMRRKEDEEASAKAQEEARLAGKSINEQRKAGEKAKKFGHLKGEISYENELSNIALLYEASENNKSTIISIYIEGAGTIKNRADDRGGLAAATGESGIMDRVYQAFEKIEKKMIPLKDQPSDLTFNIYGFSRGSFYGRFFCALLKKDPKTDPTADYYPSIVDMVYDYTLGWLPVFNNTIPFSKGIPINTNDRSFKPTGRSLLDYKPEDITINMVGLYDTVASHGWDHHNDSVYFEQAIGPKQEINKVVHITAQNEYRNHFGLVEIDTALSHNKKHGIPYNSPIGFQCSLPGAHADIGGGYIKKYPDGGDGLNLYLSNYDPPTQWNNVTHEGELYWQWYVKKGYYTTNPEKYYNIRVNQQSYQIKQELLAEAKQANNERAIELSEEAVVVKQQEFEGSIKSHPESYFLARQEHQSGELEVVKKWGGYYQVRANRIVTGNAYQYIPLKLMLTLAKNLGVPPFENAKGLPALTEAFAEVSADPVLAKFEAYVIKKALVSYKIFSQFDFHPKDAGLEETESQYLYHEYIHSSLHAEMSYKPSEFFGNYITNGSRDYNKALDKFSPMRVRIADYRDGVKNEREIELAKREQLNNDKDKDKPI